MTELKQHIVRAVRSIRADLANPPYAAPGHYYSPRTSPDDVARAIANRRPPVGVDMNEAGQVELASALRFEIPPVRRWTTSGNTMFGPADASILRAMIKHYAPRRFVEVGSGFSTAVALDMAEEAYPELQITCVEPYADRLRSRLRAGDDQRLTLIERPVQSVKPSELVSGLAAGDIFFIDSTHVVKGGSDVCHLILHTLPLIPVGVAVHLHDIFWPFEYSDEWLTEGRDWTESYLLQAFLAHNDAWKITMFGSWLWEHHPELAAPGTAQEMPGSIWLERVSG